ncbi:MAG: hypothetical protein ACE5LD_01670 [Candidatus Bipolaricaulia bacterium]
MSKKWFLLGLSVALIASAALAFAAHTSWLTGTTEEKFETLAAIQPGLGTVMIEYGNRMGNMYYAAKADNWGMAAYQLKEAVEIQEVGETTRPSKAELLKAFEESSLKPLAQDIVNQDFSAFQSDFNTMVSSCNACHQGTGHRYIVYQLPSQPAVPAELETGQTFTTEELQQILADLLGE